MFSRDPLSPAILVRNLDNIDAQLNEEDLSCLRGCEKLAFVAFSGTTRLKESALAQLEGVQIRNLALTDCPSLTSRATGSIATIRGFKTLNLRTPVFTHDCVADLEQFKQLVSANCGLTRITDLRLPQL